MTLMKTNEESRKDVIRVHSCNSLTKKKEETAVFT
jgi:hypothetical protein